MNRKNFLRALGAGAAAATAHALLGTSVLGAAGTDAALPTAPPRRPRKHWAWLRGDVPSVDAWRRQLAPMRAAGIDAVLIGGSPEFYERHAAAAREEGVELHAWIFTMMRGGMEKAHPEWYAVNRNGVSTATKPPYVDYYKFLCPSREEVQQHVLDHARRLAAIDGLASVHLDYVRYPDVILPVALWPKYDLVQDREYPAFDYCYCQVCRDAFGRQAGVDPLTLADPAADRAWLQYRYDTITRLVNQVADAVHAQGKQLTAAVFPTPTIARTLVRQEWPKWKLDAVLPMTYNGFYKEDVAWIERAAREGVTALGGRIPLYAGLYVPDLPPAALGQAVGRALAGGADGVSLFEGHMLTPAHWQAFARAARRG